MKRLKKITAIALTTILCIITALPTGAVSIKEAQSQKAELERKKKEIEQGIKDLEKEKGNVATYISKLDQQLNKLNNQIEQVNAKISKAKINLSNTKKQLKEAEETEEKQYSTMKKRIKYIYENGSSDYLDVILEAQNIGDMLNRTEYIAKISEYDNHMLERYQDTKKKVTEKKVELETSIDELNTLQEEVEMEKSSVQKLVADKQNQLNGYEKKINKNETIADSYAKKISQQDDLIEQLIEEEIRRKEEEARKKEEERKRQEELKREQERKRQEEARKKANQSSQNTNSSSNSGSTSNSSGSGFMWPSSASHTITSSFGHRSSPTAGASSYHQGIDIGAPSGSNILAAADGTVSIATYQWAAGNYVMLSHGNGISTVYMHSSKLLVSEGQTVKKGQVIALVGSTGISTGPHLHFGVRLNGTYVNPLNYVS